MSIKKLSLILIFSIVLTLGLSISMQSLLAAWTAPTVAPPDGNIAAPINESATGQSKQGGLILNTSGGANGLIIQSGNVGIGTTSPAYLLDVDGDFRVGEEGSASALFVDATQGNVGIGTTELTGGMLEIVHSTSNYVLYPSLKVYRSDNTGGSIRFGNNTTTWNSIIGLNNSAQLVIGTLTNAPILFHTNATTDNLTLTNERMRISNTGNVGIGTTDPDAPLAFSTTLGDKIQLYDNAGAATYGFGVQSDNLQFLIPNTTQYFTFNYGLSAATTELMRIKGTGDVGIGTDNPQAKLDVNGNIIASDPTASNHVATKAYVDAAGGGSVVCSDSVQVGTYFTSGGNPYYCQERTISITGYVTTNSINEGEFCDSHGLCVSGSCETDRIFMYRIVTSGGNLGGRSGADSRCSSGKPAAFTCDKISALINVDGTDEIRDMPTNYSYSTDKEILYYDTSTGVFTRIANNWADMLDGSIDNPIESTGYYWWTGGNSAGGMVGETCEGWTTNGSWLVWPVWQGHGAFGQGGKTDGEWLLSEYGNEPLMRCSLSKNVLCICE